MDSVDKIRLAITVSSKINYDLQKINQISRLKRFILQLVPAKIISTRKLTRTRASKLTQFETLKVFKFMENVKMRRSSRLF